MEQDKENLREQLNRIIQPYMIDIDAKAAVDKILALIAPDEEEQDWQDMKIYSYRQVQDFVSAVIEILLKKYKTNNK